MVVPAGRDVRPTKDRVREAVFSALEARGAVVDARVLDLYAGSGALAIEALSRGAAGAVLVDSDARATAAIATNLQTLGFAPAATVERLDVAARLAGPAPEIPFDLVFVDPPYDLASDELRDELHRLAGGGWLRPESVVVVERPSGSSPGPVGGLRTTWERTFGDTLVIFLEPSDLEPSP
jgi:16S rRNA (guanine966-N2)-methyltransferase